MSRFQPVAARSEWPYPYPGFIGNSLLVGSHQNQWCRVFACPCRDFLSTAFWPQVIKIFVQKKDIQKKIESHEISRYRLGFLEILFEDAVSGEDKNLQTFKTTAS